MIHVVPSILDRNNAAVFHVGNDCNPLSAVASKGEEERIQLFIVRFNSLDDVFSAFDCILQCHMYHHPFQFGYQLVIPNERPIILVSIT